MRPQWITKTVGGVRDLASVADQQHTTLAQARETIIDDCYELAGFTCRVERGGHERCELCPLAAIDAAMQVYETGSGQAPGA